MRKLILIALLSGCAAQKPIEIYKEPPKPIVEAPVYKLKNYTGPEAMDNNEVVQAAKQCIYAKLKPNVEYVSVKIDTGGKVLVPVSVHCESY